MTAKIVVTDHAFVDTEQERNAARRVGAHFEHFQCKTGEETTSAVRDANVAIVNFAPMGREQLEALAPNATVIRYGVGYDNVDTEAARKLGISVANVPDYGVDTVADHASALLLSLLRRLPHYTHGIRTEGWVTPAYVGPLRSFPHTTVGLLGAGRIARAVADRLHPFGFKLLAYDPYADADIAAKHDIELVEIDTLAANSQAISLHLPLTEDTHHLIDQDFLARVPEGTVIVNTSRGALVDETALAAAVSSGQIAGAGLDVFDPEPLDLESDLRGAPSVFLTPHAAFYSETSLDNLQRLAAEEAERAILGQPLRSVVVAPSVPTERSSIQEKP